VKHQEGLLPIQSSCNQLIGKLLFYATIILLVAVTAPASFESHHHSVLLLNVIAKRKIRKQRKWTEKESRNNFNRDRTFVGALSCMYTEQDSSASEGFLNAVTDRMKSVCKVWDQILGMKSFLPSQYEEGFC